MKGVSFLTDETHNKRLVQLDLNELSAISESDLEDLFDVSLAEARKK